MNKGEIKIAGNGSIGEGEYTKIKVMGSAKSTGHVVADEIKVMGNARFEGDVEGGICSIHGNAYIKGNVNIVKLNVNGDLHIEGNCNVQELKVNGKIHIKGTVQGGTLLTRGGLTLDKTLQMKSLKVYGVLNSPGDVLAEEILVDGGIQCKGLLSGENIVIHLFAGSYCNEIGATTLFVGEPGSGILWFGDGLWLGYNKKNILSANTIEADEMKLEKVTAKIARGKCIELVNKCDIQLIEYTETFNKSDNSIVGEAVKQA